MTDLIIGVIASLTFFGLGWDWCGFIMGLVTAAIFYWTAKIVSEQEYEDE